MVHNGIEYGDMQLIAEAYHLMKSVLGMTPPEMADVFDQWNKSELDSFLIEITANIMRFKDEQGLMLTILKMVIYILLLKRNCTFEMHR
jgi:6-phosphogluconate dehydrogenase